MNCSNNLKKYKNLSDKIGVNGGISVNRSGSRYLTFYVNTTDKKTTPKTSKGFCVGVEISVTEDKVYHALKTAYAYRDAYEKAKREGVALDESPFKGWRKHFVYAPELNGKDTPYGKGVSVVKKFPVTLRITGSKEIELSLGNCIASKLNGQLVKCMAPHKNSGAKAQTLGETPFIFVIGKGCEVA